MFISSCHLFHCQVCLLVSSGLNCGRFWQQSRCHNLWHLIHSLNPTAFFRLSTFSPFRLTSRYVSIQENRAFRKASLMMLTSQKARKYATLQLLFIFSWQQTDILHMARLFNEKHTHPLLYKEMVERTFSLKIYGFEPVITLNCPIICIGKLAAVIFLRYILWKYPV